MDRPDAVPEPNHEAAPLQAAAMVNGDESTTAEAVQKQGVTKEAESQPTVTLDKNHNLSVAALEENGVAQEGSSQATVISDEDKHITTSDTELKVDTGPSTSEPVVDTVEQDSSPQAPQRVNSDEIARLEEELRRLKDLEASIAVQVKDANYTDYRVVLKDLEVSRDRKSEKKIKKRAEFADELEERTERSDDNPHGLPDESHEDKQPDSDIGRVPNGYNDHTEKHRNKHKKADFDLGDVRNEGDDDSIGIVVDLTERSRDDEAHRAEEELKNPLVDRTADSKPAVSNDTENMPQVLRREGLAHRREARELDDTSRKRADTYARGVIVENERYDTRPARLNSSLERRPRTRSEDWAEYISHSRERRRPSSYTPGYEPVPVAAPLSAPSLQEPRSYERPRSPIRSINHDYSARSSTGQLNFPAPSHSRSSRGIHPIVEASEEISRPPRPAIVRSSRASYYPPLDPRGSRPPRPANVRSSIASYYQPVDQRHSEPYYSRGYEYLPNSDYISPSYHPRERHSSRSRLSSPQGWRADRSIDGVIHNQWEEPPPTRIVVRRDRGSSIDRSSDGSGHGSHPDENNDSPVSEVQSSIRRVHTPPSPAPISSPKDAGVTESSEWIAYLKSKSLVPSQQEEINWSGKGQHVEFSDKAEVPLVAQKPLGHSANCLVEQCRFQRYVIARKTISCSRRMTKEQALIEVEHLQRLGHPHIVQLIGSYVLGKKFAILLYPAADFNLEEFMDMCIGLETESLERTSLLSFTSCLLSALAYVHDERIKHMDIKPKNILVRSIMEPLEPYRVYLADFGIAKSYKVNEDMETNGITAFTRTYAAPEVALQETRGTKADMFSLGCVFSEMFTVLSDKTLESFATARAEDEDDDSAFHSNLKRVMLWLASLNPSDSSGLISWPKWFSVIKQMLQEDPSDRPSAADLLREFRAQKDCCKGEPAHFDPTYRHPRHEEMRLKKELQKGREELLMEREKRGSYDSDYRGGRPSRLDPRLDSRYDSRYDVRRSRARRYY